MAGRKLREVTTQDLVELTRAIDDLKAARGRLRFVGAVRAGAYVQRALKSAEGALRHAERVLSR